MDNNQQNRGPGKNVKRILEMDKQGYNIPDISRILRIPVWKVSDVLQKEYIKNKLAKGEEL